MIECVVKFDHMKHEVPFAASPDDVESHGREIFAKAAAGEFGPIAPKRPDVDSRPQPVAPVDLQIPGCPDLSAFLAEANSENSKRSLRGIVLTWSSMIEDLLGRLLEAFFIDHSESRKLALDDVDMTFSMSIKLSFALGLISRSEFTACDNIRRIRNAFAHEWQASQSNVQFSGKALPAFRNLYNQYFSKTYNWSEDLEFLTRGVYGSAAGMLSFAIAQRIAQAKNFQRVTPDAPK